MKKAGIIAIVLAVFAAPLTIGLMALMSVMALSGASQSQNPCVTTTGVFAPMGGPVRWPVVGSFTVTSEYGMRHNPGNIDHGQYRLHAGIDLASGAGPVVAAAAGVVAGTPSSTTGGNIVELDHGGGVTTRYLHLSSRTVTVGDRVWAGRQIGVEGATGNVSGVHLHFEVLISGQPTDPRGWLTQQGLVVPATGASGTAPDVVPLDPGTVDLDGLNTDPISLVPGVDVGESKPLVSALPEQVGVWKGAQVANAAQVIKAGQDRGLDAKTITIAVMTAMAESSLQNLDHGDAVRGDTIGLFQEGPERGPYAERMDPYGAANIFYDYLLRVPGYLDLEPTIAAHRAQANADPYHYQSRWPDAVLMVSTLTADPELLKNLPVGGPVGGCADGGPGVFDGTGDGSGQAIVDAASYYLGTPYSWGGGTTSGPSLGVYTSGSLDGTRTVGFDCSGLVLYAVYQATGIQLPHSAELQGRDPQGAVVPRDWSQMLPGDVISFSEDGSGAAGSFGHVGIYLGDGKMIHAPRPGESVQIVQLRDSSYYEPMAWSIRRYATN